MLYYYYIVSRRYEAASTLYGPHTLAAYQDQYDFLVRKMLNVCDTPALGNYIV